MYRHLTKLSLGAVASAAVIVVGFASMTGSAYATHTTGHEIEDLKGGLKTIIDRVWDLELTDSIPGPKGDKGDSDGIVVSVIAEPDGEAGNHSLGGTLMTWSTSAARQERLSRRGL